MLTLKDLNINIKVEEIGKNAIENAYIKAKSYYEVAHIPTIGMDNCLFIEELSEEEQPGTHVRRVKGRELTEEEKAKNNRKNRDDGVIKFIVDNMN